MRIKYEISKLMPDKSYLRLMYRRSFGKPLNIKNPLTFNEKLQWLKLFDRKPIYTTMVDKYEAKKYVASIIGDEFIIPTLGVWDCFDNIDFSTLPNQFVLKCTHDSGGVVICRDKDSFDVEAARFKINKHLKSNFYWMFREWPYKNVKPRIIAEQYMEDIKTSPVRDYIFFCFGGIAKCCKEDFDRFAAHHTKFFTESGSLMKIGEDFCPPDFDRSIKVNLEMGKMERLAEILLGTEPFLRADFYNINGKVCYGELMIFPAPGVGRLINRDNDELLGSWINLPEAIGGGYAIAYEEILIILKKEIHGLSDYKIHCFNAIPKVVLVCRDRYISSGLTEDFYDLEWNHLDVRRPNHPNSKDEIVKPFNLEWILNLSSRLAHGIPFLRVDFYEVCGRVYFGEMTFYPASGFVGFLPEGFDMEMGSWLQL